MRSTKGSFWLQTLLALHGAAALGVGLLFLFGPAAVAAHYRLAVSGAAWFLVRATGGTLLLLGLSLGLGATILLRPCIR